MDIPHHHSRPEGMLPIMYFEDPSYVRVPTEESRQIVRRWRYNLERRFGLYNVKLDHVCTLDCLLPLPAEDDDETLEGGEGAEDGGGESLHDLVRRLKRAEEESDTAEKKRLFLEFVGSTSCINMNHHLYGCVRSGIVHWCAPKQELRNATTGGGCRLQIEDHHSNQVCAFSGRIVVDAMGYYDRFVDDTMRIPRPVQLHETTFQRERRTALGLDKTGAPVQRVSEEQKVEQQRLNLETKHVRRLTSNLEALHHRRTDKLYQQQQQQHGRDVRDGLAISSSVVIEPPPSAVIPTTAVLRSPSKRKGVEQQVSGISSTFPATSPPPHGRGISGKGSGGGNRARFDAGYGLTIPIESVRHMRKIIIDLLSNEDARRDLSVEQPSLRSDDPIVVEYLKKVARMYALVSQEREYDRGRPQTDRNRRGGACQSISVRDLTITTLYTYARGFNINEINLIPRDERLFRQLPLARSLHWYGMDSDRRQHLMESRQKPTKNMSLYHESMSHSASTQIQQMANNFPRGIAILGNILNDL